jgi:hypothetical protein
MNTVRLNITIPVDVAESIKDIKNKSSFITDALKDKIEKEKRQKLEAQLREGYKSTNKEDADISKEWEQVVGDGLD